MDKGVYTINEVRKAKGLAPVEWGSRPLIKNTIIPLEVSEEEIEEMTPEEAEEKVQELKRVISKLNKVAKED